MEYEMKFSILVPMYNVENFLSESIDSVLQQSYQDFELILVNDGSKDSTLNIASRYKKNDHRIVIINQENKGLLQARRVAIDKSVGEYLIILDSDDLLELNMLETLKKHIDKTESDLILFKHKNIDENGSIWKKEKHPLENLYYNKDKILDLFLVEFKLHNIW